MEMEAEKSSLHSNDFNMSIVIGLLIVTLIIMGIAMNIWSKHKGRRVAPIGGSWKKLDDRPIPLTSVKTVTPPKPVYYKLPSYRKTDTWSRYLQMMQSPDKLNEVVHLMKINSPSNSTDNLPKSDTTTPQGTHTHDTRKVSYENDTNYTYESNLQQESKLNNYGVSESN